MGFTEIERAGKRMFEQFPIIKRSAKRIYQLGSFLISGERFKSEGDVIKVSPEDGYEYFYGYYDKSPWDAKDRYMIALKVKKTYKNVAPKEPGEVVLIDIRNSNNVIPIGVTHSWNVQQGCMAQWMGPDFESRIIYNDFRDGKFCSVIFNVKDMKEEKILSMPIYDISRDGTVALTLDFCRLHRMRPGYGYSNISDRTKGDLCPNENCIWKIDVLTGDVSGVFKYTDMASFEPDDSMNGAEHKVNHLMISPNGKRFMVLHRWFKKGRKHTRLVTANIDGTEVYNLSDDVFVSHCFWKNDTEILSFLRKNGLGDHYYLMKDKTQDYTLYWSELNTDGHCSYSSDGSYIITDTYPNRKRLASVYLCTEEGSCARRIARVFSPFKYDNDCRCDLHPRWNHSGDKVCIDSVHEGKRGLYVIPIEVNHINVPERGMEPMVSVIMPCYNSISTIGNTLKSLEKQTYKDFEIIIVDDGSQDEIVSFIAKYAETTDLDIIFISQKNGGVSVARNTGIEVARGKYLCFIDSDDVYSPRFLERSVGVCEELKIDTVLSHMSRDIDKVLQDYSEVTLNPKSCDIDYFMDYFMYNKENIHFANLLYKREYVINNKIRFTPNTKYGEDLEFAWKYMAHCKTGCILYDKMYGYYDNPFSAVNTVRWEKTDLIEAMFRVQKYYIEKGIAFESMFSKYFLPRTVWTTAKTFANGGRKDYYKRLKKTYTVKRYMKSLVKNSRNRLLKISSLIYVLSPSLFYSAIRIVYKQRKKK